jgi:hypothetical protein
LDVARQRRKTRSDLLNRGDVTVDLLGHCQHDCPQLSEVRQRVIDLVRAVMLGEDLWQVMLRFAVGHLGSEELDALCMSGDADLDGEYIASIPELDVEVRFESGDANDVVLRFIE